MLHLRYLSVFIVLLKVLASATLYFHAICILFQASSNFALIAPQTPFRPSSKHTQSHSIKLKLPPCVNENMAPKVLRRPRTFDLGNLRRLCYRNGSHLSLAFPFPVSNVIIGHSPVYPRYSQTRLSRSDGWGNHDLIAPLVQSPP